MPKIFGDFFCIENIFQCMALVLFTEATKMYLREIL